MLRILPLASPIHPAGLVRSTTERLMTRIARAGIPHQPAEAADANVLLILTGGTEHKALQALDGRPGPALLLAHPDQNSLPASLEILARLHQDGRCGRILLLPGDDG
ncbi:MAG TPA: hypothetical protein VN436_08040, partial [Holophaga sp.]|nr:hypothetical protein [Holophaga sp.]